MRKNLLLLLIGLMLSFSTLSVAHAATLSGTYQNTTTKSGRLYLMVMSTQYGSTGYGTSIANVSANSSGSYTIRGVQQGSYLVRAFLDTREGTGGAGFPFSKTPIGWTSTPAVVDSTNASGTVAAGAITILDQSGPDPSWGSDNNVMAFPMDGGAFVRWDTPRYQAMPGDSSSELEIAENYDVCWGPTQGSTSGGCVSNIPSNGMGNQLVRGLTNGNTVYFTVISKVTGKTSDPKSTAAVTIGNPAGGNTVTANIAFSSAPAVGQQLFVVLMGDQGAYSAYASTTGATSQAVAIPGVQDGTYEIHAILDQNANNRYDVGDVSSSEADYTTPVVTVSGSATATRPIMIIPNDAVRVNVATETQVNSGYTSYQLQFSAGYQTKRPAHIVLGTGANLSETTDMGLTTWGDFSLWNWSSPAPNAGDSYTATITFTDGTTETRTLQVTNKISTPPVQTFPVGTVTGASATYPRFAWTGMSEYMKFPHKYHVQLYDAANQYGDPLWERSVNADKLSVQYDGPYLTVGNQYIWKVAAVDTFGNRAVRWSTFTPGASSPSVVGMSTPTLACGSTAPVIIYGTGFDTSNLSNNQVFFNSSTAATVTAADSSSLTVTLPNCATTYPNPGPVIVKVGSNTAASSTEFVPTHSYSYYVNDMTTSTALSGVSVSILDRSDITPVTTNSSGLFTLTGIPVGIPYRLHFVRSGYNSVYSAYFMNYSTVSSSASNSFSLPDPTKYASFGVTSGKGVVRARVLDNTSGAAIDAVTVTAYSTLYNSSSKYTVTYGPSCDQSGGTIASSGAHYCVKNVEPGDLLIINASKTGYSFGTRLFDGYANENGQSSIRGSVVPYISSISSGVPTATITITGGNFNTSGMNTVFFTGFYGNVASSNVVATNSYTLQVVVPCGAQNGPVTVNNGTSSTTSTSNFVIPPPTITGLRTMNDLPITRVAQGDEFMVKGTNFYNCYGYYPGVVSVSMPSAGPLQYTGGGYDAIHTTAPYSTVTGKVTVTTAGGSATSADDLIVVPSHQYILTVNFLGDGNGAVDSILGITPQLSCTSPTTCTANVDYGANVSLLATSNEGSSFNSWTGNCDTINGATCSLTMGNVKTVNVTFDALQNMKIDSKYYGTLTTALAALYNNAILLIRDNFAVSSFSFGKSGITATLKGGYESSFTTQSSYSSVASPLIISQGALILDKVVVK